MKTADLSPDFLLSSLTISAARRIAIVWLYIIIWKLEKAFGSSPSPDATRDYASADAPESDARARYFCTKSAEVLTDPRWWVVRFFVAHACLRIAD